MEEFIVYKGTTIKSYIKTITPLSLTKKIENAVVFNGLQEVVDQLYGTDLSKFHLGQKPPK